MGLCVRMGHGCERIIRAGSRASGIACEVMRRTRRRELGPLNGRGRLRELFRGLSQGSLKEGEGDVHRHVYHW